MVKSSAIVLRIFLAAFSLLLMMVCCLFKIVVYVSMIAELLKHVMFGAVVCMELSLIHQKFILWKDKGILKKENIRKINKVQHSTPPGSLQIHNDL
jgi:hypothetical protein